MNPMQRRHFLKTALIGAGAAGALAVPFVHASNRSAVQAGLKTVLLRLEGGADAAIWRPLEQCSSDACAPSTRARISIDRLQFASDHGAVVVDALFATDAGLRPYRMAIHQPASPSPTSKPFAFEVDASGLAGFRAEQASSSEAPSSVASAALLGGSRPALASGRYLLVLDRAGDGIDVAAIAIPARAADAVVGVDGQEPGFACIAFSVQRLA